MRRAALQSSRREPPIDLQQHLQTHLDLLKSGGRVLTQEGLDGFRKGQATRVERHSGTSTLTSTTDHIFASVAISSEDKARQLRAGKRLTVAQLSTFGVSPHMAEIFRSDFDYGHGGSRTDGITHNFKPMPEKLNLTAKVIKALELLSCQGIIKGSLWLDSNVVYRHSSVPTDPLDPDQITEFISTIRALVCLEYPFLHIFQSFNRQLWIDLTLVVPIGCMRNKQKVDE